MITKPFPLDKVYVPVKRKKELDEAEIEALAESILENGLQLPISVRIDKAKNRLVLISGLKRLEACRLLGETEIMCQIVEARQH